MAENFSRADGWWPTGPGGKLQYWEKGKVKTPGTDAMKILRRTGSMAKDLIVKPGQMVATDVRNALSDVMKIGQYSKFTDKNGKRLTIFEARRKGLLKNYSREGGLAYHLENLGKDPFTDPTHPDYKGGGEELNPDLNYLNKSESSITPPTGTGQKPITITNKEKTDDTNKAIKEVEKNSAFSNRASGNGGSTTADTMKIANKDLKYDDPNYKLTSIQQKLVDGGWTRKELQIKREQHQKWLKDNNRI